MAELWSSDRTFLPWQFSVSHSSLVLRAFGDSRDDYSDIEFVGVDRMELSQIMPGGIVLRSVETHEGYHPQESPRRMLLVEIEWAGGAGFVAARRMRVILHVAGGADPELVLVEPERTEY